MSLVDTLMWKRYRARLFRHGLCSACQLREVTAGIYHCQRQPERRGDCKIDGKLPAFRLDDSVLEELRDAQ